MIKRVINSASTTIASGAMVLGLAGLFSRLIGVYRDRLLATTFGASASLDIYYAAFRIPDFIFHLLVLGALSAGFIPVFSEYLQKDKEKAWKLAESLLFVLMLIVSLSSLVVYLFLPQLITILTPGFSEAMIDQTVDLTAIMLFSPLLLGVSAVFGGVLQTFKRFLAYSLAPIFYNIGIIISLFLFIEPFGLKGLAYGVVLGAFLHLCLQALIAFKLGWKWTFTQIWQKEGLREIFVLMIPRTISLVLLQLTVVVITIFASKLPEGSLSIFTFTNNLAHVPVGLLGISFAVSAFPVLTNHYLNNEINAYFRTIYKTLSQILFFLMPCLVLFVLLDEQIVRLIYGAGEFTWEQTLLTAKTLLFFVPGIFAQTLLPLFARSFYAQKDTKHPLYASLIGLILTIIFCYLFTANTTYGVAGLGFAYSIASIIQALLLYLWLAKQPLTQLHSITNTIKETVVAAFAMILVVQLAKDLSGDLLDLFTVKGVLSHFVLPSFIGGIAYLFVLRLFENTEWMYYSNKIKIGIKKAEQLLGADIIQENDSDLESL